jgi:type I restriction enzyme M protein
MSLNAESNFNETANFIWSVADLIRDSFKRGKYEDVILPFTVLRRVDSVLEPTKAKVLKKANEYKGRLDKPDQMLRKMSGVAFWNISRFTFSTLLDDPPAQGENLR